MEAIIFAITSFISTAAGGIFGVKYREKLHLIISFTAGVLIAVCFFEILPEVFDLTERHGFDITPAMIAVVAGFLFIFLLEKLALIHTAHEDEYADHKHPVVGYI